VAHVMTMLEASVSEEQWPTLRRSYEALISGGLGPGLIETFLVQDESEPDLWRIVTLWDSHESIEAMRSKGTPGGVLVFRDAGAEPALTRHAVVAARQR
jgi:heme-degrading monooxygenase HmoA